MPCSTIETWKKWTEAEDFIATAKGGCEDVLINMMSEALYKRAVIEPKWEPFRSVDTKLEDNSGGLHGTAKGNWDGYRNECVTWGSRAVPRFIASISQR